MNTQEAEAQLTNYLFNGVAAEIFFADEARAICTEIGNHANEINAQGFGLLFASLQAAYSDRQTLCITKIFDKASKNYPTRSIVSILNHIENHASVWSLPFRDRLEELLISNGYDPQVVINGDNDQITRMITSYFRNSIPKEDKVNSCELSRSLSKLLHARDKIIAHNENLSIEDRIPVTWDEAEYLVNYAKEFVSIISYSFLGIETRTYDNSYLSTGDAYRTSLILRRLLRKTQLSDA